jgi:hypothetical protein
MKITNEGKNMKTLHQMMLITIVILSATSLLRAQIPAKGSDIRTLSSLHWGMTFQSARDTIRSMRDINKSTDTTITYEDVFMNADVVVNLKFTKDSFSLKSVDVQFSKPDLILSHSIDKYLLDHYGTQFTRKKEQKTKLFWTIEMEMKVWRVDNEIVMMATVSHGESILGLNIFYSAGKQEQKKESLFSK